MSATIGVSPTLRLAQAALCAALLVAATLAGDGVAGALLLAGGVLGAGCSRGNVKAARIDISGGGGIRLTVYQHMELPHAHAPSAAGRAARLLPGSTLWPGLLLLRLECAAHDGERTVEGETDGETEGETEGDRADGSDSVGPRVHWLAVLPDSAPRDVRRRLALAARAIAARD